MRTLQQGDINIIEVAEFGKMSGGRVPETIRTKADDIVERGESTGHAHRVVGTDFRLFQLGGIILAEIVSDDCKLVHEEHKPVALPVGKYEFHRTTEYDHFAEESRQLRD